MLSSADHKSGRGAPKNFKLDLLKLGLKFHIRAPIALGVVREPSRNFSRDVVGCRGDQVGTNLTRGASNNIWEGKNVQNSARFLTIFEFDREHLRNTSTCRKSE